jgi:hypothetical protein
MLILYQMMVISCQRSVGGRNLWISMETTDRGQRAVDAGNVIERVADCVAMARLEERRRLFRQLFPRLDFHLACSGEPAGPGADDCVFASLRRAMKYTRQLPIAMMAQTSRNTTARTLAGVPVT